PFEPVIVPRSLRAGGFWPASSVLFFVSFAMLAVVIFLLHRVLTILLIRAGLRAYSADSLAVSVMFTPAAWLSAVVMAQRRPAYFRVVPGRLDIMEFNPIRRRPALARHIDLRAAKITVEFQRAELRIQSTDTAAEEHLIRLNEAAQPH